MFDPIDKSFNKDALQTPKWLFDWLDETFFFDCDLCASDDHHFVDNYYTKDRSCLEGAEYLRGFCNPPYSNIQPFLDLAIQGIELGRTTVLLIPELNGEKRTKDIMRYASEIVHFSQRVSFIRPDNGQPYKGNNRGSIVAVFQKRQMIGNQHFTAKHSLINLDAVQRRYGKA
jgi:phage N-6-adenine-methyltransferase